MTRFTRAQVDQLLRAINPNRVLQDGQGHSHVSQQDVTAHLIRMFGFGGFDVLIDGPHLVFEEPRLNPQTGKPTGRWDVCYRAKATLIVKDTDGNEICRYEGSATDTAENQKHGSAHDLALKSAESTAKKRAATNLGDQFGLSLYNKGQLKALVGGTLVLPDGDVSDDDIQKDVPKQVSLGHDEIDRDMDAPADEQPPPVHEQPTPAGGTDLAWAEEFEERINKSTTAEALKKRWDELVSAFKAGQVTETHANAFKEAITERKTELNGVAA